MPTELFNKHEMLPFRRKLRKRMTAAEVERVGYEFVKEAEHKI